jgi:deoxyribodipyrimidine photolyase
MTKEISIVWFRQDLRILDNLTIAAASEKGQICQFIF